MARRLTPIRMLMLGLIALTLMIWWNNRRSGEEPVADVAATAVAPTPPEATRPKRERFIPNNVQRVRLDPASAMMTITTTLESVTGDRPDSVWVWAFFTNWNEDGGKGSRSDQPILVPVDWKGLDTVTITAKGPYHWAGTPGVPRTGYTARVTVSARSASAATVSTGLRDKARAGMTKVE